MSATTVLPRPAASARSKMRRSCRRGFTGCIFADAGKARYGLVQGPCWHGSRCRQSVRELFGSARARHLQYSFHPGAKMLRARDEVPNLLREPAGLRPAEQRAQWNDPAREYFQATGGQAELAAPQARSLQVACDSAAPTGAESDARELKCPPCVRAAEAGEFQWYSNERANLRGSGRRKPRSGRPHWWPK